MKKIIFTVFFFIVSLFYSNNTYSQDQVVKSGDNWLYYDLGELENNWFTNLQNTKNWKEGVTPIGYGDRKVSTNISFGKNEDEKHILKYFKKVINLENPTEYLAYGLQFRRDDGIAIYLNGKEIFRNNLPNGYITNKTFAVDRIDSNFEDEVLFVAIDSEDFKQGENTIAVSIHQVSQDSSDCIFDFEMFGYKDPKILSQLLNNKSLRNNELESQIKNLNTNLLLEKSALRLEVQQTRNENLTFTLFIIGFLLMIAVGGVVFIFINSRKRELQFTNNIDSLRRDVYNKDQNLMTLNTKLLHNKQYFKEIKADIKGLKNTDDAAIKDILYHINSVLESDGDWTSLQEHFNAIYSGFYDKILAKHPSLTEIELRHCMFIKLHLQTKEIARILLIDPRSVQTARYRIKKKMNLEEDLDLRDYLLKITL